ncbi:MAG: nicotinate (nicotinamide) nucleotide adenylyltransferase [Eubacterium sp.]|nr:nicotinate (nicotinamide) nucleotide adenylyltransferase [Eubacterium sp.]
MKTGIFGGAFNPVHTGHISLAENYLKELALDRIIFIPTSNPPHKSGAEFASGEDRLNMLKAAIGDNEAFEISDIEYRREGKSYSFDTICELKALFPKDEFYLIIGSDQFLYFNNWYRAKEIASMTTLCTAARNDEDFEKLLAFKEENEYIKNAVITDFNVFEISSSDIRAMVKNGKSIRSFVPEKVEKYIEEKGLYV